MEDGRDLLHWEVRRSIHQECTNFPKIQKPPQNSRDQNGDKPSYIMRTQKYYEPPQKNQSPGRMATEIFAALSYIILRQVIQGRSSEYIYIYIYIYIFNISGSSLRNLVCHRSGLQNFEVASRFLENLYIYIYIVNIYIYIQKYNFACGFVWV